MASTYWPITTNKLTPQRILLDNDLFANCRFPKGVNPTSQEKPVIDIYLNIRAEKAQKQLMPLAKRQWHQLFFMEHRNTIDATAFTHSQASSILFFYSMGDGSPL